MLHEAREREDQQAQQKEEEEALRASRAEENRKQETDGQAASSQAASSQDGCHGKPVRSTELQDWLALHRLSAVHARDNHGWSALHHVAQDSAKLSNVLGIFEELCTYVWSQAELDAVTGEAPLESHLPQGWTALHLLANGPGNQRAEMTVRLCTMRANLEVPTSRFSTPLHSAVGTANEAVTEALLELSADVNAKNKYRKTPYDMATSNRKMMELIRRAGGHPSEDWTGHTGRDERNARARNGEASEARQRRAAVWRENRSYSRG